MVHSLYNEQCASPDPEAVAISVYTAAVRKLGDHISGKLDYELLRTHAGTDSVKVIQAIKTVLTRQDASTSTGQALRMGSGHDPRRDAPAPAPTPTTEERKWVKGKDEPCALCRNAPISIKGGPPGEHLRKHCDNFKPFDTQGQKGQWARRWRLRLRRR